MPPILLQVTLTFSDRTETLAGEEARRWLARLNSALALGEAKGWGMPSYGWEVEMDEEDAVRVPA